MESEKVREMLFKVKGKMEELRKAVEGKQKAIVELDYSGLEDAVKMESLIANEISEISNSMKNLGEASGNEPELMRIKDEIRREAEIVRRLNMENRYLIFHSIIFVRKLMEIFQVGLESETGKINKRV